MAQTVGGGFCAGARPAVWIRCRREAELFRGAVCRAFMLGWGLRLRGANSVGHTVLVSVEVADQRMRFQKVQLR